MCVLCFVQNSERKEAIMQTACVCVCVCVCCGEGQAKGRGSGESVSLFESKKREVMRQSAEAER